MPEIIGDNHCLESIRDIRWCLTSKFGLHPIHIAIDATPPSLIPATQLLMFNPELNPNEGAT